MPIVQEEISKLDLTENSMNTLLALTADAVGNPAGDESKVKALFSAVDIFAAKFFGYKQADIERIHRENPRLIYLTLITIERIKPFSIKAISYKTFCSMRAITDMIEHAMCMNFQRRMATHRRLTTIQGGFNGQVPTQNGNGEVTT